MRDLYEEILNNHNAFHKRPQFFEPSIEISDKLPEEEEIEYINEEEE